MTVDVTYTGQVKMILFHRYVVKDSFTEQVCIETSIKLTRIIEIGLYRTVSFDTSNTIWSGYVSLVDS